jgi:hypothetical protein
LVQPRSLGLEAKDLVFLLLDNLAKATSVLKDPKVAKDHKDPKDPNQRSANQDKPASKDPAPSDPHHSAAKALSAKEIKATLAKAHSPKEAKAHKPKEPLGKARKVKVTLVRVPRLKAHLHKGLKVLKPTSGKADRTKEDLGKAPKIPKEHKIHSGKEHKVLSDRAPKPKEPLGKALKAKPMVKGLKLKERLGKVLKPKELSAKDLKLKGRLGKVLKPKVTLAKGLKHKEHLGKAALLAFLPLAHSELVQETEAPRASNLASILTATPTNSPALEAQGLPTRSELVPASQPQHLTETSITKSSSPPVSPTSSRLIPSHPAPNSTAYTDLVRVALD